MALPEPILDDLRFQRDLVDVARKRIIHYCPEWTDYNLSDPGITLIELFAWMTELITYRLNRVPEKNHLQFLNMLGVQLQPPSSAQVDLTFRLSAPFPLRPEDDTTAIVPKGTEVASRAIEDVPEVIFTTNERLTVVPPQLTQLRKPDEFNKNALERLNVEVFQPFNTKKPEQGDAFYIGFDGSQDISGHILQLHFSCEPALAPGIKRNDPPLVWECAIGDDVWEEIMPSTRHEERDTTGGLNNPEGDITFYLPRRFTESAVFGREGFWVRCQFKQRRPEQGTYTESPRIKGIQAYALGATGPATHAVYVYDEVLGRSNGESGQDFQLNNAPLLELWDEEYIEVEEMVDGEMVFKPWTRVFDFSMSSRFDRHFMIDTATGEINFGPAIRQRDGTVRQYGRIPETDRLIRINQYRYGGGDVGNVPAGEIQVFKTALPYIDRVTNSRRAAGGRNQETIEEAKMRARRELRAQQRAVTVKDYEYLTPKASRAIARVKCNAPTKSDSQLPPGMVELLIVPAVADSLRNGDLSKLHVSDQMGELIQEYLDEYRLLTTTLYIREPNYLGVQVTAEIVPQDTASPDIVQMRVIDHLNSFLAPLPLRDFAELPPAFGEVWEGWEFGRDLYVAELYSLLQQIPGVKHVLDVQFVYREVVPSSERLLTDTTEDLEDTPVAREAPPLITPEERMIPVPADTLLCSLKHNVIVKYL